jgi:hypothetical protein
MKKLLLVPLALALFSLSACNKWKDFWDDHDHDADDYKDYKITKFDVVLSGPGTPTTNRVANITYDSHNNPLTVIFDQTGVGSTNTNYKFVYDGQNRLSKCYMYYNQDHYNYFYYIKYLHDGNGRIVSDTMYFGRGYSDSTEPSPGIDYYAVNNYTYDAQGRITKVVYYEPIAQPEPSYTYNYSYDAKGNMVRPGYTYDNKVNFMRTNKVWQFINREYSQNNPISASSYNNAKLPKTFDADPPNAYVITFLGRVYRQSTFTYTKIN